MLVPLKIRMDNWLISKEQIYKRKKDGKLVWALSAEKIEYDPRTKAIVLTNLKGLFYQDDVTTTITAPHAVLTGDRNSLDIDQGVTATNTDGAEFKTDALHFDNKTKTLTSKSAFTYNGKDITLTGDKLEGNMSLKKIKAIGNAKLTKEVMRGNIMNKKNRLVWLFWLCYDSICLQLGRK